MVWDAALYSKTNSSLTSSRRTRKQVKLRSSYERFAKIGTGGKDKLLRHSLGHEELGGLLLYGLFISQKAAQKNSGFASGIACCCMAGTEWALREYCGTR
jgi:hypothetical protein